MKDPIHLTEPASVDMPAASTFAILRKACADPYAKWRRIDELERALLAINNALTDAGNDERHLPQERFSFRASGAIVREHLARLGL